MTDFVECRNCGTIHYVISRDKAKALKAKALKESLMEEFSSRNLSHCSNCGSKNQFAKVSEYYVSNFSSSSKIPPIFLGNEQPKRATDDS